MAFFHTLNKEWTKNRGGIIDKATFTLYLLALATTAIVIGSYFFIVYYYSVNIPFWDDYTHLNVIAEFINSDSLLEQIKLLFSLHNEHRLVFARLITLAELMLSGEVNFITLIMLGNLSLLGIAVLLFLTFDKAHRQAFKWRTIYFLPAVLLIFNLSYFEASIWALAAVSSLVVIFLSFLCIFILIRSLEQRSWWTWGAFLAGVLAAFSQGNGLFVLYVGVFLLILKKRFATATYWGVGTGIISILYFYHYKSPGFHYDQNGIFAILGMALHYLTLFLGAWSKMPMLVGATFLTLFLYLVMSGLHKRNIIFFGFLIFIFLSALAASASRYEIGIDQALSSRYKIYSLLFFAILYLSIFEFLDKRWIEKLLRGFPVFLIVILGINVLMTAKACSNLKARRLMLVSGLVAWQQQGKGLTHWDANVANRILTNAIEQNIYHPPKFSFFHRQLFIHSLDFDGIHLSMTSPLGWIDTIEQKNKEVRVLGWVPIADDELSQSIHIFLPIKPISHQLKAIARPDVTRVFKNRDLDYSGFKIKLIFNDEKNAILAASKLCIAAESKQTSLTLLHSKHQNCQAK